MELVYFNKSMQCKVFVSVTGYFGPRIRNAGKDLTSCYRDIQNSACGFIPVQGTLQKVFADPIFLGFTSLGSVPFEQFQLAN